MGDFALLTPINLSSDASTSPILTWDSESLSLSMPIQGYVIYGTNPTPEFDTNHPIPSVNDFSYQLTGLQENTTYYWCIYYDCDGGSSVASDIWSFNTGGQALQPPASAPSMIYPVSGSVGVSGTPTITFATVEGATGYDIQITTDWNFAGGFQVDVSDVGADGSYVVQTPLSRDWSTYYLRIRSRNSEGVSDWGERVTFELGLDEITQFFPETESLLVDGFSWNTVGNTNGYDLKVTEVATGRIVANRSMGPNSASISIGILNGMRYKVEVRAAAINGNYGPWAIAYYYGPSGIPSLVATPKDKILKDSIKKNMVR